MFINQVSEKLVDRVKPLNIHSLLFALFNERRIDYV